MVWFKESKYINKTVFFIQIRSTVTYMNISHTEIFVKFYLSSGAPVNENSDHGNIQIFRVPRFYSADLCFWKAGFYTSTDSCICCHPRFDKATICLAEITELRLASNYVYIHIYHLCISSHTGYSLSYNEERVQKKAQGQLWHCGIGLKKTLKKAVKLNFFLICTIDTIWGESFIGVTCKGFPKLITPQTLPRPGQKVGSRFPHCILLPDTPHWFSLGIKFWASHKFNTSLRKGFSRFQISR